MTKQDKSNNAQPMLSDTQPPRVALFVTCLVDLFRPSVAMAGIELLASSGCRVEVPEQPGCCGQPAYNIGDNHITRDIARQVISAFETYDYVVAPSGSCSAMLKKHYPPLFDNDPAWRYRADKFGAKVYELTSFLIDVCGKTEFNSGFSGCVSLHDSCSGLRELGIKHQPRALLNAIPGVEFREQKNAEVCCGFGGTFCVKYSDISDHMVSKKIDGIIDSGANVVTGGDLGCLLNIAGKLTRTGSAIDVRHIAEILANIDIPPIGKSNRQPD